VTSELSAKINLDTLLTSQRLEFAGSCDVVNTGSNVIGFSSFVVKWWAYQALYFHPALMTSDILG